MITLTYKSLNTNRLLHSTVLSARGKACVLKKAINYYCQIVQSYFLLISER